jgi:hypothetical protein
MAQLIVEIHPPLVDSLGRPADDASFDFTFDWIEAVGDYLMALEESGGVLLYDDGEEFGDEYLFFLTGPDEQPLLAVAADVARLPGVPKGAYATVTDDEAGEMGVGRREPLPQD